jgi:hypothetical protein
MEGGGVRKRRPVGAGAFMIGLLIAVYDFAERSD